MSVHTLLDRLHESGDLSCGPLDFELHTTIGQIFHEASDLELLGNLKGAVAKTDALHAASEKDRLMMYFAHKVGAVNVVAQPSKIQPAKIPVPSWRETGFCIALSEAGQHGAVRSFNQNE